MTELKNNAPAVSGTALRSPSGTVDQLRSGTTPSAWLSRDEAIALVSAAGDGLPYLACLLMWRLGLRVVELTGDRRRGAADGDALAWGDIDLESGFATIRRGKGGKSRRIPIHQELKQALHSARRLQPNLTKDPARPLLYNESRKKAPGYRTVLRWVKEAFERAVESGEIKPKNGIIGTHILRHSAARHWENSHTKVSTISTWLGHTTILVTQDYLRTLSTDQAEEMAGIE